MHYGLSAISPAKRPRKERYFMHFMIHVGNKTERKIILLARKRDSVEGLGVAVEI